MRRALRTKLTDLAGEIQQLPEQESIRALRLLVSQVATAKGRETRHICYQIIDETGENKDDGTHVSRSRRSDH